MSLYSSSTLFHYFDGGRVFGGEAGDGVGNLGLYDGGELVAPVAPERLQAIGGVAARSQLRGGGIDQSGIHDAPHIRGVDVDQAVKF